MRHLLPVALLLSFVVAGLHVPVTADAAAPGQTMTVVLANKYWPAEAKALIVQTVDDLLAEGGITHRGITIETVQTEYGQQDRVTIDRPSSILAITHEIVAVRLGLDPD